MMYEQPMGKVIDFPDQEIWEVKSFPTDHLAEVHYLCPEYEPVQDPVETLAKVVPFERQHRAQEPTPEQEAQVSYLDARFAPPSQEGIETTKDVLVYLRGMYDYYGMQNHGFEQTDGTNEDVLKAAIQARQDAHKIAEQLLAAENIEDARLALEVFGDGEAYSRRLKSSLIGWYAERSLISDTEAVAEWKSLLEADEPAVTTQVYKDFDMYVDRIARNKAYGRTEISRHRIKRLDEQMGIEHSTKPNGGTPSRGA